MSRTKKELMFEISLRAKNLERMKSRLAGIGYQIEQLQEQKVGLAESIAQIENYVDPLERELEDKIKKGEE